MSRFDRLAERLPVARDYLRALRLAFANIPTFENIPVNAAPESLAWVRLYFAENSMVIGVWFDEATNMARTLVIKGDAKGHESMSAIPCADEADARRWVAILNAPSVEVTPRSRGLRVVTENGKRIADSETRDAFSET